MQDTKIDECILMVQSPEILYCYWELSVRKKDLLQHHLNGKWNKFHKKLRLYDITDIYFNGHNAHKYADYLICEQCNEYFLKNLHSNRTYCVDIGVETKDGSFFSLLRSNPIDTPRSTQSEVGHMINSVSNWKEGQYKEPEWLEGFSSYTYYEK